MTKGLNLHELSTSSNHLLDDVLPKHWGGLRLWPGAYHLLCEWQDRLYLVNIRNWDEIEPLTLVLGNCFFNSQLVGQIELNGLDSDFGYLINLFLASNSCEQIGSLESLIFSWADISNDWATTSDMSVMGDEVVAGPLTCIQQLLWWGCFEAWCEVQSEFIVIVCVVDFFCWIRMGNATYIHFLSFPILLVVIILVTSGWEFVVLIG